MYINGLKTGPHKYRSHFILTVDSLFPQYGNPWLVARNSCGITSLRLKKFDVSICPDPKKALELCDKRQFDLIITDQKMPVMTGTEFAAIAKDKQPKARTLLISGYINEKEAAAAIENEHINRFVAKSWHNEDILSIVESELQIGDTILSEKKIDSEPILLNAS